MADDDLVQRLRRLLDAVARLYGEQDMPEGDLRPVDSLWFVGNMAADEIERLRAEADRG